MVLSKKSKGFNPHNIGIECSKFFINESLCRYQKFYGVNAKFYGQRNGLKLFRLAMAKSKSQLNLKVQFLKLLTSEIYRNYFQAMIFSLNKFTITSHH